MSRRVRVLLAAMLSLALVVGGSSAAWALWSASAKATSSTTIGKLAAGIKGAEDLTTTFSSTVTSLTKPLTLMNSENLRGTTTTSVRVTSDSSSALAQAIDVVAWPVPTTADCTDGATVGSGSISGTWASLPSMTTTLAAHSEVVWCTRSTPRASAPASATANVIVTLTTSWGPWVSAPFSGGFYLNTSAATAATPALTCTDHDDNYVDLTWPASSRPPDTWYAAYVGDTRVGQPSQEYSAAAIQLAPSDFPASVPTGTATVVVKVIDSSGAPTTTVAGSGPVTRFTKNDGAAIRCGA
ncbi:hypothetical protein BIU98_10620 [Curtobacterium sp. MMLR14_010]|uniref:hypothetical protein n=1 Tax=Curtobacterium sp. MMLR14_010 TaxID=1898743 RepID=UPI0008DD87B0|nr:hypothetical protein [Curtobacterium sp. MMLR14_010]OII39524.1 hypothetical protein BIU98_10620 [Curtobacterium sp. MMLR14_010]